MPEERESPEQMAPLCTPEEVITMADEQYQQVSENLSKVSVDLHERGYHQWSAAVGNMRTKFETAMHELVDELMPDEPHKSRESRR